MRTLEEFTHFCASKLNSDLELLKSEQGKVVRKLVAYRSLIALMILFMLGFLFSFEMTSDFITGSIISIILTVLLLIAFIIIFIYVLSYQRKIKAEFVNKFKTLVIKSIVNFFDENLDYQPQGYIPQHEFAASGIIKRKIDRYYGDDLVEGKIGLTNFKFSEVHALVEEKSDDKSRYVEVFGGIFFIGDFNKNFSGQTYVLPDRIEKGMGRFANFFQSLAKGHGKLVKLEDIEFEKEFVVYSTDQIEARYILSTSLMQRILEFKRKAGSDIMLAFKSSNIYVAIPKKGSLFEPKIFGKLIAEETLRKYYEDLAIAISTIEDLNLNLRIWTKQ